MSEQFSIGVLSRRTLVHIETIRYYEKIGLLPEPERGSNGHRIYSLSTQKRLHFIRRGRELGFKLADIRSLLGLNDCDVSCIRVSNITTKHLKTVRKKILQLQILETTLAKAAALCDLGDQIECPIIDVMSQPDV